MAEKEEKDTFIQNITDNYRQLERSIVNQLSLYNKYHPSTTGFLREDIWMQLFEAIVPKKFVIEHSIFIIDSYGQISKEVDLAIIDQTYTPYIFRHGKMKFVPIEAVAAVIECKSKRIQLERKNETESGSDGSLVSWCNSIQALRTSMESVVRMATGTVIDGKSYGPVKPDTKGKQTFSSTQTSTRPIRILCGYETDIPERSEDTINKYFDFILRASDKDGKETITIMVQRDKSLQDWYKELNHYGYEKKPCIKMTAEEEIQIMPNQKLADYALELLSVKKGGEEVSLLSFNFQLNQLLMLINNPILFPHLGYARMFNGEKREWGSNEGNVD